MEVNPDPKKFGDVGVIIKLSQEDLLALRWQLRNDQEEKATTVFDKLLEAIEDYYDSFPKN